MNKQKFYLPTAVNYICYTFLFCILSFQSFGQRSNDFYRAILAADNFYGEAKYEEAVKAYEKAFKLEKGETWAGYRLDAAASYCMLDNEEDVKRHLFALIPVSSRKDMERVLVNYAIFNKYKHTDWWKELEQKLNQRLKDLIAHHKNLHIFQKGRNFVYSAIRVNAKGDTLANTFITLKPGGTGWGDEAAAVQSQVVYEYEYTLQDSLDHAQEMQEVVTSEFWRKKTTTGVIENESQVWIHPFRLNEFYKTEVAPFPEVNFPISNEKLKTYRPEIIIMEGWGTYSYTSTMHEYKYIGTEERNYAGLESLLCYKFEGLAANTGHGLSQIEYYFNKDYGFVEMKYDTYDHDIIHFVLVEIVYEGGNMEYQPSQTKSNGVLWDK